MPQCSICLSISLDTYIIMTLNHSFRFQGLYGMGSNLQQFVTHYINTLEPIMFSQSEYPQNNKKINKKICAQDFY